MEEAESSETEHLPVRGEIPVQTETDTKETSTAAVDINRASSAELETLPGIGPTLAGRIIEYREQNGAFQTPEELTNVKGIGEKTLEKFLPYIICG